MVRSSPEKRREYERELYRQRREEYLSDKSCVMCTATDNLQVDHIDPTQKVTHRIWLWGAERRAAELAKCQVLCQPCHRDKTTTQTYGDTPEHGSSGYRKGCRCIICRSAEATRMADYRRRVPRKSRAKATENPPGPKT